MSHKQMRSSRNSHSQRRFLPAQPPMTQSLETEPSSLQQESGYATRKRNLARSFTQFLVLLLSTKVDTKFRRQVAVAQSV
jgi:hypothetical protein